MYSILDDLPASPGATKDVFAGDAVSGSLGGVFSEEAVEFFPVPLRLPPRKGGDESVSKGVQTHGRKMRQSVPLPPPGLLQCNDWPDDARDGNRLGVGSGATACLLAELGVP